MIGPPPSLPLLALTVLAASLCSAKARSHPITFIDASASSLILSMTSRGYRGTSRVGSRSLAPTGEVA